MKATDGKMRATDCANTKQLLLIIQSIPGLKKENLRDNMTNTELVLNVLAEISKATNPQGMSGAANATVKGGSIAKNAREALEALIGHSVISPLNTNTPNLLDDK